MRNEKTFGSQVKNTSVIDKLQLDFKKRVKKKNRSMDRFFR